MTNYLRIMISFVLCLTMFTLAFSANKRANKIVKEEAVYFEKGMRHHLVVMKEQTPDGLMKVASVVDTIQHATTADPAAPWDEGIQSYAGAGAVPDTVVNWYWLAADEGELLEIHASYYTTGTGSWNVWGWHAPGGFSVPNTADSKLLLDVPWTVTDADTTAEGVPTGNWQVLDLAGQGLGATIPNGVYVGEYFDATNGPKMFMDDGDHALTDGSWRVARMYIASFGGWYYWANSVTWTEFAQRIVVRYEQVAPLVEKISTVPDYFAGNPAFPSVTADVYDLDGTVQSAELVFQVGASGAVQRADMALKSGDMYEGSFGVTFTGGDTVHYWIETSDDAGNSRQTSSSSFNVVAPPAKGTDIFYVVEGGEVDDAFVASLNGKDYYTWDIAEHGAITGYEINWGFNNILWYGFGSANLPSPYETGDHAVKTYLDNGGNLMIVDADYLYIHGYDDSTLTAGTFGYDYLGLEYGRSDVGADDSVHYGVADDPISGAFLAGADSLIIMPNSYGVWSADYGTDWMDYLVPREDAVGFLATNRAAGYGFDTAIRMQGTTFNTALFGFRLAATAEAHLMAVVDSTFNWFNSATAIDDNGINAPQAYALNQNYPNPFNPTTNINFSIAKNAKVELTVYNALGQKIATLINKNLAAGSHDVVWNGLNKAGQKVSTGIYYYKLKSENFTSIKKMLLVK